MIKLCCCAVPAARFVQSPTTKNGQELKQLLAHCLQKHSFSLLDIPLACSILHHESSSSLFLLV